MRGFLDALYYHTTARVHLFAAVSQVQVQSDIGMEGTDGQHTVSNTVGGRRSAAAKMDRRANVTSRHAVESDHAMLTEKVLSARV